MERELAQFSDHEVKQQGMEQTTMKRLMAAVAIGATAMMMAGCGGRGEPSNAEIERGMKESFIRNTGAFSADLDAKAKKIGNGRWSVRLTAEQNGQRRSLNATAVMDRNGDIHYYTD